MPLHLPDFRQESIHGLTFCSLIHRDTEDHNLGELPLHAFAKYDAGGIPAILFVILEKADDDDMHYHFHVNVDRQESARDTSRYVEMNVDDLKDRVEVLFGDNVAAYIDVRYLVPRSKLPRGGMIETLLGVSTHSCGSELELRGSRFAIDGDPFTEMDWRLDDESDCIRGTLAGETETIIGEDFLIQIIDLLDEGIECFVLENITGTHPHASDNRTTPKQAQG